MKKTLLAISLILLIGIASGCLGGSSPTKTTSMKATTTSTSQVTTPSTTARTTTTSAPDPLQPIRDSLDGISRYTYEGNISIHMNITVLVSNLTQNNPVALFMHERGYIDLSSREAMINTTTLSEPGNTTVRTIKVIKNGKTYLKTVLGPGMTSFNVTDNVSTFVWDYTPLSLAKRYINETPDRVIKNGKTTELVYTLTWQDIKTLTTPYLAVTPDTGIEVKGGRLILTFKGDELTGVKVEYSVLATSIVTDPTLGQMTVKISAKGSSTYRITSINKKMNVEPPT